jgi:archaemetzincin
MSCDNRKNSQVESTEKPTFVFQPFAGFPLKSLAYVKRRLIKTFPEIQINQTINLPINALNQPKTRYRADALLNFLSKRTKPGFVTIGFTTKDISTSMGAKGDDWGIFGLGGQSKQSCIVSTYRLKGQNKLDKLYKLAIHEIGHTQGLMHCTNEGCFMMDAHGKDHFNKLKGFCASCEEELHE